MFEYNGIVLDFRNYRINGVHYERFEFLGNVEEIFEALLPRYIYIAPGHYVSHYGDVLRIKFSDKHLKVFFNKKELTHDEFIELLDEG